MDSFMGTSRKTWHCAPAAQLATRPPRGRCYSASRDPGRRRPLLQRLHVDHEAVLHVALGQALVGLVDLLDRDQLDVGAEVVLGAEVEHLLRLADAADRGARE